MNDTSRPNEAIHTLLDEICDFSMPQQEAIEELVDQYDRLTERLENAEAGTMAELGAARLELEQAKAGIAQRDEYIKSLTTELQLAQGKLLGVALIVR